METLVIVGASLAGLSTARAARRQGFTGRLVLIGDDVERPYDRPPLSKDFLAGKIEELHLSLEDLDEQLDAQWLLGRRATSYEPETRHVLLDDGTRVYADHLVIATGACARHLPDIAHLDNVFTLRTLDDARRLRPCLTSGKRLVVVGAGFIGAEVASTAHALGMDVTVIEKSPAPLAGPLGADMGAVIAGLHRKSGVELLCGVDIERFDVSGGRVNAIHLAGGRDLPADVVLVGIGAQPNVEWLADSGMELGNGVLCDAVGRTNLPGVVAVGDCAAWLNPHTGRHQRVEHWSGALDRPAVAVGALLGHEDAALPVELPYFWSDQYGRRLQFVGDAASSDRVVYELGDADSDSFLAVYNRGDEPVAVLALDQPRLFTRWRKTLNKQLAARRPGAGTSPAVG